MDQSANERSLDLQHPYFNLLVNVKTGGFSLSMLSNAWSKYRVTHLNFIKKDFINNLIKVKTYTISSYMSYYSGCD